MDMSAFCIVQTTIDDAVRADDIAEALIERKLAACVQIAPVTSHYVWQGAAAKEKEFLLAAKARLADFPQIAAAIFALIAICGLCGAALVVFAGIDPLTAYLATSPGGADSIAIIAASSPVDVPFVMALQTARLILVLAVGPSIARFVANLVRPDAGPRHRGGE